MTGLGAPTLARDSGRDREGTPAPGRPARVLVGAAVAIVVLGFVVARFVAGAPGLAGPLWLDEALSVTIARRSLPGIVAALRQDGSPPLYYLLLHAWMLLFGESTVAVRALSGILSVASLAVAWIVGRRIGGTPTAVCSVIALAACPFAIRYASETRMYALVMLLTLLGVWAAHRAWTRPRPGSLVAVALITGALLLTHYWTAYLVIVAESVLIVRALRIRNDRSAFLLPGAVAAGGLLFLPWAGTFLYQLAHTGAPWASAADLLRIPITAWGWAAGDGWGIPLVVVWAVALLAALRTRPGRILAIIAFGSLSLGVAICWITHSGLAARYSAPMAAMAMLAVGHGLASVRHSLRAVLAAGCAVLCAVVLAFSGLLGIRTQAGATAAALTADVRAGDLVVYCPDQLGPAVSRLLPASVRQVVYPSLGSPELIDWADYANRNASADPAAIAATLSASTRGRIFLIGANGYRTFGSQCAALDADLAALRGGRAVLQTASGPHEAEWLIRYPAP